MDEEQIQSLEDEPVETRYTLLHSLESLENKFFQYLICKSELLKHQHEKSILKELQELKQHIIKQNCNFTIFDNPI